MKVSKLVLAAALAMAATPALAQSVAVGATIYGSDGEVVGTVAQVGDGIVTIDTGKHKAALPADAVGKIDKGPAIGMTKAELDGQLDQLIADQAAKMQAALVAGAAVADVDGAALGTIKSVDASGVVVESPAGAFTLQPEHFSLQGEKLTAAVRAADVAAQLKGSAG
jgi:sporulation protein YlmC with PRC-barrel domain